MALWDLAAWVALLAPASFVVDALPPAAFSLPPLALSVVLASCVALSILVMDPPWVTRVDILSEWDVQWILTRMWKAVWEPVVAQ